MAQEPISWKTSVGLNHVGAYQVSGQPFATGSINCIGGSAVKISFPNVTQWFIVFNNDTTVSNDVKIGFSENGLSGNNFFTVPFLGGAPGLLASSGKIEVKVSEIWLTGSGDVDIVAGLTNIDSSRTSTAQGSSWSGSAGVG